MAFPVVNIRPRVLPQAVPSQLSQGVQQATEGLLGFAMQQDQARRAEEAAELGFQREQDLTRLRAAENRQTQLEVQRQAAEGRIEAIQADITGRGELAREAFEREAPLQERRLDIQEGELGARQRGLDIQEDELGLRRELGERELGIDEANAQIRGFEAMTRAEAVRRSGAGGAPLSADIAETVAGDLNLSAIDLEDPEVRSQLEALTEFGRTGRFPQSQRPEDLQPTAGSAQGTTRVPPGTSGRVPDQPGAGQGITSGFEEDLQSASVQEIGQLLMMLPEDEQRQILRVVGPEKARAAQMLVDRALGIEGRR